MSTLMVSAIFSAYTLYKINCQGLKALIYCGFEILNGGGAGT